MNRVLVTKVLLLAFFAVAGAAALGFACFLFGDALLYYFVYDMAGRYDRGGESSVHVIATIGAILGGAGGVLAGRYMAKAGFCHSRKTYLGSALGAAMVSCLFLLDAADQAGRPWGIRWTVLPMMAACGAAMGAVLGAIGHHCWLAVGGQRPGHERRWQFSIRELLAWTAVFGLLVGPLAGAAHRRYSFHDRRRATTAPLLEQHAMIDWHSGTSAEIEDVRAVRVWKPVNSADWDQMWETLRQCRNLEELEFVSFTLLNDTDLERLKQLPRLRVLKLSQSSKLSDAGLKHIGKLSGLEELELTSFNITSAGLAHLKGLKRLRKFDIFPHGKLRPGLQKLKAALPECEFQWDP